MILAAMLREDRDALVCDLAETYGIFNMKQYPASLIATFAAGLRGNARIWMKMQGQKISGEESLLALLFDKVNWLCWAKTKDAEMHRNAPKSLYRLLTVQEEESGGYDIDTFEKKRRELMGDNDG